MRFARNLVGVLLSTGSTYLLFVVFSRLSSLNDLGRYSIYVVGIGALVTFVDGFTGQRIFQQVSRSHANSLGIYNVHRLTFYAVVFTAGAILSFVSGFQDGVAMSFYGLGQGAYASVVSLRVLDKRLNALFRVQIANFICFSLTALGLFAFNDADLTTTTMLVFNGAALLASSIFFAARDWPRQRSVPAQRNVLSSLYGKDSDLRSLAGLMGVMAVNAIGSAADTLLASFSSTADVGRYQMIQKPLLGLGAVNVALGQSVMNSIAHSPGKSTMARKMRSLSPILLLWPTFGFTANIALIYFFGSATTPAPWIGALLGCAHGIAAVMQITGAVLIARGSSLVVFWSVFVQLITLVGLGLLLVPHFGLLGVGISFALSRVVGASIQLKWAVFPQIKTTKFGRHFAN